MKNFKNYTPEKYSESKFQQVEEGIYCTKDPYGISSKDIYVTSLSFEMEPERYCEEDASPRNITQIPFECLLDEFSVYVTDFYDSLNEESETVCYQEYGASDLANIQKLRTIIGKSFYAVEKEDYDEDDEDFEIVFE